VYIPETIQSGKNTLHLSAMVVHDGYAHYTANFKRQGNWFFYDDNRVNSVRSANKPGPNPSKSQHKIKYIGSYEKMLKNSENDPRKLGTLFFYT
jgi:ubiquitin C-terminal hydrolase